jgi:hypothetical protein
MTFHKDNPRINVDLEIHVLLLWPLAGVYLGSRLVMAVGASCVRPMISLPRYNPGTPTMEVQ